MEILSAVAAYTLTLWFIIPMFILAVLSDYSESKKDECGWASLWAILCITASVIYLKLSTISIIIILAFWIPIGLCWAIFKWKLRVNKTKYIIQTEEIEKDSVKYNSLKENLDINKRRKTVTYWVLFFPISIVSTCFINIFDSIEYLVTVKFGNYFKKLSEEAFK